MKKKIIIGISASVIVIVAIAAGIVTGISSKKKSSNDINVSCKAAVTKNEDITCYDWLKKLCNKMGVEADDYRKAAKEYGYITDSDEFSNDDIASGGFMALTSMRAMGEGKMQIYLGTDDAISDNTNIELAINNNLIAEDSLDRGFLTRRLMVFLINLMIYIMENSGLKILKMFLIKKIFLSFSFLILKIIKKMKILYI